MSDTVNLEGAVKAARRAWQDAAATYGESSEEARMCRIAYDQAHHAWLVAAVR